MRRGDLSEVAMCAAIDIGYGNDVGTCGERLEYYRGGCGTRGKSEGEAGMFKSGNGIFKILSGLGQNRATFSLHLSLPVRIRAPRIFVCADRLANPSLFVGCGEGDLEVSA